MVIFFGVWHILSSSYTKTYFNRPIGLDSVSIQNRLNENREVKRALFEAQSIKVEHPNVTAIIVQFENGLGENPYNYITEDSTIDCVVNLSGRKRKSEKPRYNGGEVSDFKEFKKLCCALSMALTK